jgi:hypothetical protein
MAENIPNPDPGAPGVPPKKAETGKVQPKKETVRISLPPKPTAAPTIKLPTLPAAGPPPRAAAPAAPAAPSGTAAAPTAAPAVRAPAPPAPPAGSSALRSATPTGNQPSRSAAATPAPARVPSAQAPVAKAGVSGLDLGLSIAAAVVGLGAVVSMILLLQLN